MKRAFGRLRVIAGRFRGRYIDVPDIPDVRPTTDRIRETLFNWLQTEIAGARCLDLFAGSGALGIEALSRGAAHVTFIDQAREAVACVKKNLAELSVASDQGQVLQQRLPEGLERLSDQKYTIVFLDPPFAQGLAEPCCSALSACAAPGCLIYLETEVGLSAEVPSSWRLLRQQKTRRLIASLYQVEETEQ